MSPRPWRAAAVLAPALLLASLGAAGSAAAATTGAPGLNTSNFACSNGVCEVGPGNVGTSFAAGLPGTGGPTYYGPECDPYIMSVVGGSLPPGLRFTNVGCSYAITGTPAQAGTYSFTVQVTEQPNSLGQPGQSGTQRLTVTIGTGHSDRLANVSASYNGHQSKLNVSGFDANIGALYSVSLTSTGQQIIAPQSLAAGGEGHFQLNRTPPESPDPCYLVHSISCNLTVTDSLGSSVTVTLPPPTY
jgi:hypothetical protein